MKVAFINPPFKSEYGKFSRESRSPSIGHSGVLYYPLWLIYAAATVERSGITIEFLDAPAKQMDFAQTIEKLNEDDDTYGLVVINTSTPSIYSDVTFGALVKERYPNCKIMLVGTHPSALPEETLLLHGSMDIVAIREFDQTVLDVAVAVQDKNDLATVDGIAFRTTDGTVKFTKPREYLCDLDQVPMAAEFIKRHLDINDYVFPAASYPAIQIFTGRGCPARCNYCVYPQTVHGHKYRLRSAESVVGEFAFIAEHFPDVHEVVIEDDTFTANKKRVLEICNLLISSGLSKKLRWLCNARVNLDYETMRAMKEAGCHLVIPGVESYNQEILNNIRKGITLDQIDDFMSNAKKAGLMVHACYMVGNRGETRDTMDRTLEAALRFDTDTAQFFPLIPYPGTEAYDWAKDNGYISGEYSDYLQEDGTLNCVLNLPNLTATDLVDFCSSARKQYYLRPRYILYRLWHGLTNADDLKRSLKAFWVMKGELLSRKQ